MPTTRMFGTLHGSRLYGLATPQSDTDIKGLLLPDAEDILTCRAPAREDQHRAKAHGERNNASDVDVTFWAAPTFVGMLTAGDPTSFEVLFAPPAMHTPDTTPLGRAFIGQLQAGVPRLLSQNVQPFVSYAQRQVTNFRNKSQALVELKALAEALRAHGDKLTLGAIGWQALSKSLDAGHAVVRIRREATDPKGEAFCLLVYTTKFGANTSCQSVIDFAERRAQSFTSRAQQAHAQGGVDFKALSHALRVLQEGHELVTTGALTFPRPNAPALLAVKLGRVAAAEVLLDIDRATERLVMAARASSLPAEPDRAWAWGRVVWLHGTHVAMWQLSQRIPATVADEPAPEADVLTRRQSWSAAHTDHASPKRAERGEF